MISHIEVITKMYILTGSDTTHTQKLWTLNTHSIRNSSAYYSL